MDPSEVRVGVSVAIHRLPRRAPVETEVRESVGCGLLVERIDGVDETEVLADFLDDMRSPGTAKFDRLRGIRPNRFEEAVERGAIGFRRAKGRRRLEHDHGGSDRLRNGLSDLPPLPDRRRVAKGSVRGLLRIGNDATGPAVRGRRRLVRDELRRRHAEPELWRRLGPPLRCSLDRDGPIEGLLNLDRVELCKGIRLAAPEPARAGANHEADEALWKL